MISSTLNLKMRCLLLLVTVLIPAWGAATTPTLRMEYQHSGSSTEEQFALASLTVEGEWPGRLDLTLDNSGLGQYFFELHDAKTGRVLYSRGFNSTFGEWVTTPEAKELRRSFSESIRVPLPTGPAQLILKKRDTSQQWNEVWSLPLDPNGPDVQRPTISKANIWAVMQNGPPSEKVDLLLVGDGYTAAERDKWHADAQRLTKVLFAAEPFHRHQQQFNVWAIDLPAEQSGITDSSRQLWRSSPVRSAYNTFEIGRYILSTDDEQLREAIAAAPYEFVEIVVNDRRHGGGGIFNQYATVAADGPSASYVMIHEFSHHFAGLADEYFTSPVTYEAPRQLFEPWYPNVTIDPKAAKWSDLVTPGTPLPTPWPKAEYQDWGKETQEHAKQMRAQHVPEPEIQAYVDSRWKAFVAWWDKIPYRQNVGAFEGANYQAIGYYRPQLNCVMGGTFNTSHPFEFCAVCRRAIERIIYLYAKP